MKSFLYFCVKLAGTFAIIKFFYPHLDWLAFQPWWPTWPCLIAIVAWWILIGLLESHCALIDAHDRLAEQVAEMKQDSHRPDEHGVYDWEFERDHATDLELQKHKSHA